MMSAVKKRKAPVGFSWYRLLSGLLLMLSIALSACGTAGRDSTAPISLVLRLSDLPSREYSISKEVESDNRTISQQYPDPPAILKQFTKWGRKSGYFVEYTRQKVTPETSKAGPLQIQSNVSEYATADGAYQGLLFELRLIYLQTTSFTGRRGAAQFVHTRIIGQRSFLYTYSEVANGNILVHYLLVFQRNTILATVQTVTIQGGQTIADVANLADHIDKRISVSHALPSFGF